MACSGECAMEARARALRWTAAKRGTWLPWHVILALAIRSSAAIVRCPRAALCWQQRGRAGGPDGRDGCHEARVALGVVSWVDSCRRAGAGWLRVRACRRFVRPTADALDPWRVAPQSGPEYASDSTAGGIEAGLSSSRAPSGACANPEAARTHAGPWRPLDFCLTTSCSNLVHTTPKSAKRISCSSNSAGKRNIVSPA